MTYKCINKYCLVQMYLPLGSTNCPYCGAKIKPCKQWRNRK